MQTITRVLCSFLALWDGSASDLADIFDLVGGTSRKVFFFSQAGWKIVS